MTQVSYLPKLLGHFDKR